MEKDQVLSMSERGVLGGNAILERKGKKFLAEIGQKGRESQMAQAGSPETYAELMRNRAKRGGEQTALNHSSDDFSEWGKVGGERLKELKGKEFFSKIGRLGAAAKKAKKNKQ